MFLIKLHIASHCIKYKVGYYLIGTNGCIEHVSEDLTFAREVKLIWFSQSEYFVKERNEVLIDDTFQAAEVLSVHWQLCLSLRKWMC